jgi:hypothetical protein
MIFQKKKKTWAHAPMFQTRYKSIHTIHEGYLVLNAILISSIIYLLSSLTLSELLRFLSELLFLELVGLRSVCSRLEAGRRSRSVLLLDEFGRLEGPSSMGSSSSSIIRPSLSTFASRSRRVSRPRLWQYQKTKRRTKIELVKEAMKEKEGGLSYRKVPGSTRHSCP